MTVEFKCRWMDVICYPLEVPAKEKEASHKDLSDHKGDEQGGAAPRYDHQDDHGRGHGVSEDE